MYIYIYIHTYIYPERGIRPRHHLEVAVSRLSEDRPTPCDVMCMSRVHVCIYVCIYVYTYVYIYIYIHIYIRLS